MRSSFLSIGEPAPWFVTGSISNPQYRIHTVAGRYVVLCFFASAGDTVGHAVLEQFVRRRAIFDDDNHCFFGISTDREDETQGRVKNLLPGIRFLWDFDRTISRDYGLITEAQGTSVSQYVPVTYVLDTRLRTLGVFPIRGDAAEHVGRVVDFLATLPKPATFDAAAVPAPILIVPNVFEPELCQRLIDEYDQQGGAESGFMRDINGKTVSVMDHGHKRRRDVILNDIALRRSCMVRIHDRLIPEIQKSFQFHATRLERYLVACYDSSWEGHFGAHRDNTTKGTAHRRFAVSLNLNTGQYEGGGLRFPEFGHQEYKPPLGGAVVFSCSLLHEARPVTRGRRFTFLPFLFDDAAAKLREQNQKYLESQPRDLSAVR